MDQKGFISGRFIGENIRLIYDVLFEVRNQDIPGLILSVDFEKAFDTISWKFIEKKNSKVFQFWTVNYKTDQNFSNRSGIV